MLKATISAALVALMLAALVQTPLPVASQPPVGEAKRAELMLEVAEKAYTRLEAFIDAIKANETVMVAVEEAGLLDAFQANASACERIKGVLEEVRDAFEAGDYDLALNYTRQAMRMIREIFKGVGSILEQVEVEKGELVKAYGLIEAAKHALNRIERLKQVLPEGLEGAWAILDQAENLLNVTEIAQMLQQGNVSEAAKRIAEANRLVAEAFKMVKVRAEEGVAERTERFIEKLEGLRQKVAERLDEVGINASEIFEGTGIANLTWLRQQIRDMEPSEVKEIIKGLLRNIGDYIREFKTVLLHHRMFERPKIADILGNPEAWDGKAVYIEGEFCGWEIPEGVPGPTYAGPPETGSDWIISDGTGWIYVTGRLLIGVSGRVAVIGEVEVKEIEESPVPYIKARTTFPLPRLPELPSPQELLGVSVQKEAVDRKVLLNITVTNNADETVVFPNGAYGVVIMKRVWGMWIVVKAPISIQIFVKLQPSESASLTVMLHKPSEGLYKAVSMGWLEESHLPVAGSAEFTLP